MMLEAPGYEKLITALYPEGDEYIQSDAVFGELPHSSAIYSAEQARADTHIARSFL